MKSTERTNAGSLKAAELFWSEAGMALEAVLALEAVVDAFQTLGSAAVEDTCPEGMHVEVAEVKAAAVDNCPERMDAADA